MTGKLHLALTSTPEFTTSALPTKTLDRKMDLRILKIDANINPHFVAC